MMEVEYVQWHVDLREPLAHLLAWVDFIESGDRENFKTWNTTYKSPVFIIQ
jgi:hypothetical protein